MGSDIRNFSPWQIGFFTVGLKEDRTPHTVLACTHLLATKKLRIRKWPGKDLGPKDITLVIQFLQLGPYPKISSIHKTCPD